MNIPRHTKRFDHGRLLPSVSGWIVEPDCQDGREVARAFDCGTARNQDEGRLILDYLRDRIAEHFRLCGLVPIVGCSCVERAPILNLTASMRARVVVTECRDPEHCAEALS